MKHVLGAALFCVAIQACYGQFPPQGCAHKDGVIIEFTSYEAPNWGSPLSFDLRFLFGDTIEIDDTALVVTSPGYGLNITLSDTFDTLYQDCDTLTKPITIGFDTTSLPYSYVKVNIALYYTQHGHRHLTSSDIYLYFTPWRTVEVWNYTDFAALPRLWEGMTQTATRPYINPANVPGTNIPTNYEITEDWQERQPATWMDGLAYGIPQRALHPDSITNNDSTAANKKVTIFRYNGVATGNVSAFFREDFARRGNWLERPLCGLRVELWNRGGLFPMAVGTTDMDGNFNIPYDVWKSMPSLQVRVRVLARNDEHDIRGYDRFPFRFGVDRRASDRQGLGWNGTNNEEDIDFGNLRFDVGTFRGVSQCFLAWELVEGETDYDLIDGLDLGVVDLPGDVGNTFFWPDAVCANVPNSALINTVESFAMKAPSIFLERNERENTVWHEFGHFLMWQLQDGCWTELVTSTGEHNWFVEENPRLSFTEGFATGFQTIADLHYHYVDLESQFDGWDDLERRREWEDLNGYLSEYYFAMALRDLFDGANQIQSCFNFDPDPNVPQPFFRDVPVPGPDATRFWQDHTDDYEFPLELLFDAIAMGSDVDPLGNGQVSSIGEYFANLLSLVGCEDRIDIGIVFEENRISWRTPIPPDDFDETQLSTDIIGRNGPQETIDGTNENLEGIMGGFNLLLQDLNLTTLAVNFNPQNLDVNELNAATGDFNIGISTCLTDELEVDDNATLFINNETVGANWVIDNDPAPTTGHIEVETHQLLFIDIDGNLQVGTANRTANLTINERLWLNGSLVIEDGSEVILAPSSHFVISSPANIVLNGPDAVLRLEGWTQLNPQASLSFTGEGRVIFDGPAPNSIQFFQNSGISLQGTSTNQVVAEFHQNDFYCLTNSNAGSGGVSFSIETGTVLLGANTRLAVSTDITLDQVTFERLSATGNEPRGLWLYGQENIDIEHADFYDFEYGINALSKYGNFPLELRFCEFYDCYQGLRTEGLGTDLYGCNFEGNTTGWYASGMTLTSEAVLSDFTDNNTGIEFRGEAALHFEKCNINGHAARGIAFYGTTLSGWCSDLQTNDFGIHLLADELILSPDFRTQTGRVNLANNDHPLAFTGTWLRLNNGINDFDADDWLTSTNVGIAATIRPKFSWSSISSITAVYAEKSVWDHSAATNFPVQQYYNPLAEGNYIIDKLTPTGTVQLPIDPPTQVLGSIGTHLDCPTIIPGGGGGPSFPLANEGDMHNTENGTPPLDFSELTGNNNHEFQGDDLQDAVEITVDDMYNELLTDRYTEATHRLHDILMVVDNEGWEHGPDGYVSYLTDYAYLRMMEAFGRASMEEDGLASGSTLATEVMAVQQRAIDLVEDETETTDPYYYSRFRYSMQLAETRWLVLDYTNAMALLNSMLTWTTGAETDAVNNAKCRIDYENDILDGTIALTSVDPGNYPCSTNVIPTAGAASASTRGLGALKALDEEGWSLYPNPAQHTLMLTLPPQADTRVALMVYDAKGRLVQQATQSINSQGVLQHSVADLPEGLYIIECKTTQHTYRNSFNVQR